MFGRRMTLGCLLAVGVIALAGCGNEKSSPPAATGGSTSASEIAPSATPETTGALPNLVRPQIPGGAPTCQTANLAISVGGETGAAGTTGIPIVFTNNGTEPCVVSGFPGVSYSNAPDGGPIGAPAVRDGAPSGPVFLAPGAQASALVLAGDVHNYPSAQCAPVSVSGLRVYPPDNTDSSYLPRAGTACSLTQASQLRVRAVVAGVTGQ